MRKIFLAILLCVVVVSCASADIFSRRDELSASIIEQAWNILLHNKPVFDDALKESERHYEDGDTGTQKISRFVSNRICAKDKTLVIGASDGENFQPCYFVTEDPAIIFAGGVRVGADVSNVKDFNDMGDDKKIVWGSSEIDYSEFYTLFIDDKRISRVEAWIYIDDVPITQRTINFAERTAKNLRINVAQENLQKLGER